MDILGVGTSVWLPVAGTIGAGIIAGVVAGFVTPWANYRYNERTKTKDRQVEMLKVKAEAYKTLHPLRVEAAKELMGCASEVFSVYDTYRKYKSYTLGEHPDSKAIALDILARRHSWLLGANVQDAAYRFALHCNKPEHESVKGLTMVTAYKALGDAVTDAIHVIDFEQLYEVQAKNGRPAQMA